MQNNNHAFGKRKAQTDFGSLKTAKLSPSGEINQFDSPVLEGLVCSVQQSALLTAVIASWVNSLSNSDIAAKATDFAHYAPQDPTLSLTLLGMIDSSELSADAFESLGIFAHAISDARDSFLDMMDEAAEIGIEHATILHRNTLVTAWRELARKGLAAMKALEPSISGRLPPLYADACAQLRSILADVIAGNAPCIDAAGDPMLPTLPQRRSSMRRSIIEDCRVTVANQTFRCMLKDISPGGLGLTRVPVISVGNPVAIEMSTGRVLEGRVAWCRNSAAGVQFSKPLPPDDPLLAG